MMHANASYGDKVLPIARISIRNTGVLRTIAEASGNNSAGRQPPMRWRSQEREGAYARENSNAAMIIEVTVTLGPKLERIARAESHETRDINTSFISILSQPQMNADVRRSEMIGVHPRKSALRKY